MSYQQERFKEIAEKIREKTGTTELIKPNDFPEKIDEVYETGKKLQYDFFWDAYQQNGALQNYTSAFSGKSWTKEIFKPKYDIKPTNARLMFNYGGNGCNIDMVELSKELGIVFDFSKSTSFYQCFCGNFFKRLGIIDTTAATHLDGMFIEFAGDTIDKLIIRSDGTTVCTSSFSYAKFLNNITIEGVIGNDWNMQWCPLSKDSIINIINVLSNTTSGLTVTFKKSAINNAFGIDIDDETTYPEGSEYYILRNTKRNWTFSYA